MYSLKKAIRNCPTPVEIKEAGHFVQEWGGPIVEAALKSFNAP
jgi:hypothetical protein